MLKRKYADLYRFIAPIFGAATAFFLIILLSISVPGKSWGSYRGDYLGAAALFEEWSFDATNGFDRLIKNKFYKEGIVFGILLITKEDNRFVDYIMTFQHYSVSGIDTQLLFNTENQDTTAPQLSEAMLQGIRIRGIKKQNYVPSVFFVETKPSYSSNYDAVFEELNRHYFGGQFPDLTIDQFNPDDGCRITRYRTGYEVLQTFGKVDDRLKSRDKAACFFTAIYVNFGLSNARAVHSSPDLVGYRDVGRYHPAVGLRPLAVLYDQMGLKDVPAGTSRKYVNCVLYWIEPTDCFDG